MTCLRRAAVLAVLVAITATIAPGAHSAGSAVGLFRPADVTCNAISNTIQISASFGAGTAYSKQRLAYQLYLYNATSRQWTQLLVSGQTWDVVDHQREQVIQVMNEFGVFVPRVSIVPWAPTPNRTYYFPGTTKEGDGTYYVYARYIWLHNGAWIDRNGNSFSDNSPWELTTYYMNTLGSGSACRL
jgi:hypothetical protein